WCWLPHSLELGTFYVSVEIQIDRGPIHDLRYLISFVVVVERAAIECQCTIKERVFRTEFEGVNEFRLESQRVCRLGVCSNKQHSTRWIGAACLVAMSIGAIDECLVSEIELRCPIHPGPAGKLIPLLIDNSNDWIPPTFDQQPTWYLREMFLVFRPAQP